MVSFNVLLTPAIVIVVYIIIEIAKRTVLKTDKKRQLLPLICTIIGGVFGLLLFVLYPVGSNADNIVGAFTSGAFSGLAATGCNQLYKQLKKFGANWYSDYTEDSTTDSGYKNFEIPTDDAPIQEDPGK